MSEIVHVIGSAELPETYTEEEIIDAVSPHAEYIGESNKNEGVCFNLNEEDDGLDKIVTFHDSGSIRFRGFSEEHFGNFVEALKDVLSESGLLTEDQMSDIEFDIDKSASDD